MRGDGCGLAGGGGWLPLLETRVRPATLARYRASVTAFLTWCIAAGLGACLSDAPALDYALALYAHGGEVKRSQFEVAVCGVKFFLPMVSSLPYAAACLKGWRRHVPVHHKAPMLFIFTLAFAQALCRRNELDCAAGILVQSGGFLRPSELLRLELGDVVLPEEAPQYGANPTALLALGTPVRGTKVGREQVAHVRHPWAIAALRYLKWRARARGRARARHVG